MCVCLEGLARGGGGGGGGEREGAWAERERWGSSDIVLYYLLMSYL